MKSNDQLILESLYGAIYKTPNLVYGKQFSEQEIGRLLEQDLQTIEELIEEGFFGDLANKAKQGASSLAGKVKDVASNLKQGLTKAVIQKVIGAVLSKLSDQEKAKFFGMILDGKVDKSSVQELKQNIAGQQVQESLMGRDIFEDDKEFFVNTFFTESVLTEAIQSTNFLAQYDMLLSEQNRPLRQAMQYSNEEAAKLATNVITKLRELYGKNPKYLKLAVPKIAKAVNSKVDKAFQQNLGVSWNSAEQTETQASQPEAENTQPEAGNAQPEAENTQPEAGNAQQEEQTKKPGFIQRVLKFVSSPKVYVTAGLAVAVVGFIAAIAGGAAVAPLLGAYGMTMAKGAGAKVLWGAIGRKMQGKKIFDAKAMASDAGKGALMGAAAAGLGSIVAAVSPLVKGMFGAGEVAAQTSQPAPSQSTQDEFSQHHATDYDKVSTLDQGKGDFMDALKDKGIVGKGQWSNNASPAFTNAAGDMNLKGNDYIKLGDKIRALGDDEVQSLITAKDSGNQAQAMETAKEFIKKALGKK